MDDPVNRAEQLRQALGLAPHPEGGHYRELYRSSSVVPHPAGGAPRAAVTAIHFLLRAGQFSAWHRVRSDEVWCIHDGSLELHLIAPDGGVSMMVLGIDVAAGQQPTAVVPAGWWQAARPTANAPHALCSCIVAPGFDFADFEMPGRDALLGMLLPEHADLVAEFTRPA